MEQNLIQTAIQQRQAAGKSITNLSFADFTFHEPLLSSRRIQESFDNVFSYPYYYPTARGEEEACQAISDYYERRGEKVDPNYILLTSTINQSLLYLLKILSSGGGEILVTTPHSPSINEVAYFLGIKLKNVAMIPDCGWQIDLDDLKAKITPKTKALLIMTPDLPTGAVQSEETLTKLLQIAADKKLVLIVDESLSDFIFNHTEYPQITKLKFPEQPVLFLHSLSNSFGLPGLKISWIRASGTQEFIEEILGGTEYLADTFLTLNQISQTILPEIVKYSRKWRKNFIKVVEKNRDIATRKLSKSPHIRMHFPEGGFYCLAEVKDWPADPEGEDFVISLLNETGIYVHPGRYYGQNKGCYFMVCFLQDHNTLRRGIKKITKFLKSKLKKTA